MQKDTVKDWERATLLCDQIRIDADAALAVVNDLPAGWPKTPRTCCAKH
mgnify:CR=1 FL=1